MSDHTNRFFFMTQREILIQRIERTIELLEEIKPNNANDEDMNLEGSAYLIVLMDLTRRLNKLYEGMKERT